MLKEELFDTKIKAALDQIEAPYDPATWLALEQKMSVSDLLHSDRMTNSFDQLIQKALANHEAPFDQAHWEQMSIRIDRENRIRRRIWITKFAEAAIFLLLIVNIEGMLHEPDSTQSGKNQTQIQTNEPVADHIISRPKSGKFHRSDALNNMSTGSNTAENTQAGFWAPFKAESSALGASALTPDGLVSSPFIPLSNEPEIVSNNDQVYSFLPLPQSVTEISVLDPLPILSASQALSETFSSVSVPQQVKNKIPKQRNLYASLFVSPIQNQIRNGSDYRKHNGLESGVTVGYRKGKWGAESGLVYSRKSYQPKKNIEIYDGSVTNGYYASYADQVNADVITIPVRATRRIAKIGKSTILAIAGVTANIAVVKEYRYKSTFYPGLSPQQSPGGTQAKPSLKKQGKGLLENGSFDDNFYATADAGIRVEHPINHKLVAYLEPSVQTAITNKGIGPSNSKINSIGFRAGVIASL